MQTPKIIATIGPASIEYNVLKKMYSNGMNIARINTKYGSLQQYNKVVKNIKRLVNCKLLFDIKGNRMLHIVKEFEFDYLAVSFAESGKQIQEMRKLLYPKKAKIIAKIETLKGIKKIDELIEASDGIMVARGDLGDNIPIEKLPIAQKHIITKCNRKKKMVITATEMLFSMINSKEPERAEVSDVANAVFDGSDALMLSEETAIGKYPAITVNMMAKIIKESIKWKKKNLSSYIK